MKKLILVSLYCVMQTVMVLAAPALKDSILITQPDGSTVYIYLKGDEFGHIRTTTDGYPLQFDDKGYLRYAIVENNQVISPLHAPIARDRNRRSAEENSFISTIKKADLSAISTTKRVRRATAASTRSGSDYKLGNFPVSGKIKGLIILAEFADNSFSISQDYHHRLMNEEGFSDDGATGSARDYYLDQSMQQFDPSFDVFGPVKLSQNIAFYGENNKSGDDKNPEQMVVEACKLAKDQFNINFSDYDFDNDGEVDMVYIIYAGYGEHAGGAKETIWPHMYYLGFAGKIFELDNKKINTYACSSELMSNRGTNSSSIGTFCHEFSHVLGLPDLYPTAGGDHYTLDKYDIMVTGCYNNRSKTPSGYSAFERYSLGWLDLKEMDMPADKMELKNIIEHNTAYKLTTPLENEFFILENRQHISWDSYLPSSGLMITHVYYSKSSWQSNKVNNISNRLGVKLIVADNIASSTTSFNDLYPNAAGNNKFTNRSTPSSTLRNGKKINKWVTNIAQNEGVITFDFMSNYLDAPTNSSSEVHSSTSFTASWSGVEKATSYEVTLNKLIEKTTSNSSTSYNNYDREVEQIISTDATTHTFEDLAENTLYSYTVAATSSNYTSTSTPEVIVQTLVGTGIEDAVNNQWMSVDGKIITLELEVGETIEVYSIDGTRILQTKPDSNKWSFELQDSGSYIIRKGNIATKVTIS